jgi:hypothetical protein
MEGAKTTTPNGDQSDSWLRALTKSLCKEDSANKQGDGASENTLRRSFEIARLRLRVMNQPNSGDIRLLNQLTAQRSGLSPVYHLGGSVIFGVALLTEFASGFEELDGNFAVAQWLIDDGEGDGNVVTDVAQQVIFSISAQLRQPEFVHAIGGTGVRQLRLGLNVINAAMNGQCSAILRMTGQSAESDYAVTSVLNAVLSIAGMVSCALPDAEVDIGDLLARIQYPALVV